MITSCANAKVKQVIQWQNKAKERRSAGIFLTEGFKMFEEAPGESMQQIYLTEEALERVLRTGDPLLVVLEELQDPGNLGTIIRTGEAAGVTGVIMSAGTVDLFNPKTIRATMGSVFRVPFLYVDDLPQTVEQLRQGGISVYAAHLEGKTYYDDVSFLGPTAFLVGNEGNGLTEETASRADRYLKIPMEGRIESLNAAVAASLFMYETHRQRSSSRTGGR